MTQSRLYEMDRRSTIQCMARMCVPEPMRRNGLLDPSPFRRPLNDSPDLHRPKVPPLATAEYWLLAVCIAPEFQQL